MAANTAPIFSKNGNVNSALITTANTSSAGGGTIGTDIFKVLTAGAEGDFVSKVRFIPVATTPTSTTATVGRVFISSITSGATTSADTWLIGEVALPAQSADSASVAVTPTDVPLGFVIPAGYTILATTHHTPAANTHQRAVAISGNL